MNEDHMRQIAAWIVRGLRAADDADELGRIRGEVEAFCSEFPVPGI